MNTNSDIAIVIPAYKSDFFEETFKSIVEQTDSCFHLYIGNDGGDKEIEDIIHSFGIFKNVTYKYFEDNLGQKSLIAHWNRCLEMFKEEMWVWFFGDDDVMDSDCIENFRKTQSMNPEINLFKFNSIKFTGDILLKENNFPDRFSLIDFLKIKFGGQQESYAIEYIFNQTLLKKTNGFPNFPLGWCSDDLFWIRCLSFSDVITISDSSVYWRYSNYNISGSENTNNTANQKMRACIMFMNELSKMNIFKNNNEIEFSFFNWILNQYIYLKKKFSDEEQGRYLSEITHSMPNASQYYKMNLQNQDI